MKVLKVLPLLILAAGLVFTGCKPKDADVKAAVEKALKENPATAGVMVMVTDGVATLSGEVADDAAKTALDASVKAIKGVKSVVNNATIPAPPAPVVVTADDPLTAAVKDATKDHPSVTAAVADGVIKLTGSIEKAKWIKLKQALDALSPKKVDAAGLKIN
ncbi:MAG TPA: BON domain-containing protein [Ferruginibacter sp.]|nr:BON domain-containing protein [Ferruginibacter sp.]HRE62490.1 BON domain-containing protein [Ferruginibacter sp.]